MYPAYVSYNTVLNPDENTQRYLLMFWTVNTCFTVVEMFGDLLGSWVPLYYEAKIVFIIFLTFPKFRGAKMAYKFVAPYLRLVEPHFDDLVGAVGDRAQQVIHHVRNQSTQFISGQAENVVGMASQVMSSALRHRASAASRASVDMDAVAAAAAAAPPIPEVPEGPTATQ